MRHSYGTALFVVPRRRIRLTTLCIFILIVIAFPFFHANPRASHDVLFGDNQRLSRYLEVVTPWTKPAPTQIPMDGNANKGLQPDNQAKLALPVQEDIEDRWGLEESYDEDLNNLPKHTLNGNGLLITNPDGAHPIYELTRRAKFEWGRKHRRASKTLRQAVDEYKRRYGRLPPRGFDHWCVTTRCHQLNSISR